ncbi:hypothetical protein BGZ60DRAFT_529830 [Tricladium varicosporioides]|nr:hypothetical protein BGZ60DRAFT_529830 [Hymenoscyphus varicosporioides]
MILEAYSQPTIISYKFLNYYDLHDDSGYISSTPTSQTQHVVSRYGLIVFSYPPFYYHINGASAFNTTISSIGSEVAVAPLAQPTLQVGPQNADIDHNSMATINGSAHSTPSLSLPQQSVAIHEPQLEPILTSALATMPPRTQLTQPSNTSVATAALAIRPY